MWAKCKIVNFSWLLFSTLLFGQNLLRTKKHPFKVECKCILLSNRPPRRFMHSLCKNEHINSYVGKAPSPHNKRNCYPPFPDHYLMRYKTHWWRELRTWSHTINLIKTSANSPTKTTNSIGNVLGQQSGLNDGLCYEGSRKFYTNFGPVSYSPRVSPSSFWEAMISILSSNHFLQFCIILISFE